MSQDIDVISGLFDMVHIRVPIVIILIFTHMTIEQTTVPVNFEALAAEKLKGTFIDGATAQIQAPLIPLTEGLPLVDGIRELESRGYECRTGHQTSSSGHDESQSESGETAAFVVLHKTTPRLLRAAETSHGYLYEFEGMEMSDGPFEWEIFHGETALEAWEDAVESIPYMK